MVVAPSVDLMTSGVMLISLERQKFVDRRDRVGIVALDAHFPAPRPVLDLVADLVAMRPHHVSARNGLRVDRKRLRKITGAKGRRNVAHVRAHGSDARAVHGVVTVEDNTAAVRKIFEYVAEVYWFTPMMCSP